MLEVHCENRAILEALTARHLAAGEIGAALPRHARDRRTSRPRRPGGRSPSPAPRGRRSTSSTSRPRDALAAVRAGPRRGAAGLRGDLPALPDPDRRRATRADPEEAARFVISPPLRAAGQPDRAVGRPRRRRRSRSSPRTTSPTGSRVEKQTLARVVRPDLERRRRASRRCSTLVYDEGVARGRITVERMVDLLSTTPARLFGLAHQGRARGRARRRPRAVRPGRAARTIRAGRPPPLERLHAVRGPRGARRGALDDRPRRRSSCATASSSGGAASGASSSAQLEPMR